MNILGLLTFKNWNARHRKNAGDRGPANGKSSSHKKHYCRKIIKYPNKFIVVDYNDSWYRERVVNLKCINLGHAPNQTKVEDINSCKVLEQIMDSIEKNSQPEILKNEVSKPCTSLRKTSNTSYNGHPRIIKSVSCPVSAKINSITVTGKNHINDLKLLADILNVCLIRNKEGSRIKSYTMPKVKIKSSVLEKGKVCIQSRFYNDNHLSSTEEVICYSATNITENQSQTRPGKPPRPPPPQFQKDTRRKRFNDTSYDTYREFEGPNESGVDYSKLLVYLSKKICCISRKKSKGDEEIRESSSNLELKQQTKDEHPRPMLPTIIRPVNSKASKTTSK